MAKRKKKGRANPAAESPTNVAEAEVRPTESEIAGEVAAQETTGDAQPETVVEAQTQETSEAQPATTESVDEPAIEVQPEDIEVEAEFADEAPADESAETSENPVTGEPAVAIEEIAAEEGMTGEEPTAEESLAEDEPASEEPTAEESLAEDEPASEEPTAEESLAEDESTNAEPVAEESASEDQSAAEEGAVEQESAGSEAGSAQAEPSGEEAAAEDVWAEDRVAAPEGEPAPGETSEQDSAVWAEAPEGAESATVAEGEAAPTGEDGEGAPAILDSAQMESIIEGLLFASDRVLGLADFKRLLEERDGKKITAAIASLSERRKGTGIEVVHLSNGWHLRTNSEHARWVSKLLAGKPMRLSRAMMETLAIVAYRQPVTRPEIDEIRGVDCGPVLKTLLDRGLVRVIGKKEDVGRPMLYGTTPEFLRVFNLRELTELPTLREYAELNSEQQAVVNAKHGPAPEGEASAESGGQPAGEATPPAVSVDVSAAPNLKFVPRGQLPEEPEDNDPLLDELDAATKDASKILGAANEPPPEAPAEAEGEASAPTEPSREP